MDTRDSFRALTGPLAALLMALAAPALFGCATKVDDTAAEDFLVVGAEPEPGAEDATVATQPEFKVNAAADAATCTADSIKLVAITADGAVLYEVEYSIVIESEGSRIRFVHEAALSRGDRYAAYVDTGAETVCADVDGRPLIAYGMEFAVE